MESLTQLLFAPQVTSPWVTLVFTRAQQGTERPHKRWEEEVAVAECWFSKVWYSTEFLGSGFSESATYRFSFSLLEIIAIESTAKVA